MRRALLFALLTLSARPATFPTIESTNLNKEKIVLPRGLKGDWNLVLIAFERKQQADIDTWLKVLPAIAANHPRFAYYELPTISRMNPLMRWFINSGMRGGIPSAEQRARTITLYLDKKPFLEALAITAEDRIHALLIDKSGKVLWRAEGLAAKEKSDSLVRFLESQH